MGPPLGNQNAAKDKDWISAIRRALARAENEPDGHRTINHIADKLLEKAAEGDLTAIALLGDRLDGRPQQSSDVTLRGSLHALLTELPRVEPPRED